MVSSAGQHRSRQWLPWLIAVVCLVVVCALVFLVTAAMEPVLKEQGERSLQTAVLNAANQCFAVEGAYPANLKYLEDHYGLVVNKDDYSVSYEVFADNVIPKVVVVAK